MARHTRSDDGAAGGSHPMTSKREVELRDEMAALRVEIGTLREAVADLQQSTIRWRRLYEAALRRCEELQRKLKKVSNSPN